VRAEGYDAAGELVAADEVILNQTRGAFGVEIAEPPRGFVGYGTVRVRAEVTVPEERRVERVELRLNDTTFATLALPPWTAEVEIPEGDEVTYLSAVATLDDGRQAEAVRFLNAPQFLEEVDVRLVELYVSVIDRSNRPVLGLGQDDFEVLERGVPQEITKFELVENLPLSVGITIDTSGSMVQALAEAQRAGQDFLRSVMTPRDRCFVIGFAQSPELLMAPTDDTEACLFGLAELRAVGSTSLHDAVVTSLYYFRGMKGQRALVLLSDGDDTSSNIDFQAALEYARHSGVAIYSVGLGVSALELGVRSKLGRLAEETGGRVFYISHAAGREVIAAAEAAHAMEFIRATPEGLNTLIGENGLRLSGGQRQRLAIARALLKNTPVLILDEATSALDTETERAIQQSLAELSEGRTTLVIAHRLATIINANRILVVDDGRIVEQGSHAELLARKDGHYRRLHAAQAGHQAGASKGHFIVAGSLS
jgi:VWFA-related protein